MSESKLREAARALVAALEQANIRINATEVRVAEQALRTALDAAPEGVEWNEAVEACAKACDETACGYDAKQMLRSGTVAMMCAEKCRALKHPATPPPATPAPATCPTCGVEVSYVEEGRCPNGHSMTAPATVAAAERVEEARVAVLVAALKWHRTYIPITNEKDARSELHNACDALLAAERAKGATS